MSRRDRKRQATADLLTQTAFRLFEVQGFDLVSMEQIAAAADVAKGTLYNHFPCKEALLVHYFRQELASHWETMRQTMLAEPDCLARFELFLDVAADWAEQHKGYVLHYLRYRFLTTTGGECKTSGSGTAMVFTQLIRDAQDQGRIHAAHPPAQLASYLQFLYMGALLRWLASPAGNLRQEFSVMLGLFLQGACIAPSGTCKAN